MNLAWGEFEGESKRFVRKEISRNTGCIVYEGLSELDGAEIFVVMTYASKNSKTGPMNQVWIMRKDQSPLDAVQSGADSSVCGDCVHRGRIENGRNVERSCYVNLGQAPMAIYKKYKKGGYPRASPVEIAELSRGVGVRLGAYGDPAAVPFGILENIVSLAKTWTGYTHQWRRFPEQQVLCMASADNAEEAQKAVSMGFRVFQTTTSADGPEKKLMSRKHQHCPASDVMGNRSNCNDCGACDGQGSNRKSQVIQIRVHGKGAKHAENRA